MAHDIEIDSAHAPHTLAVPYLHQDNCNLTKAVQVPKIISPPTYSFIQSPISQPQHHTPFLPITKTPHPPHQSPSGKNPPLSALTWPSTTNPPNNPPPTNPQPSNSTPHRPTPRSPYPATPPHPKPNTATPTPPRIPVPRASSAASAPAAVVAPRGMVPGRGESVDGWESKGG